MLKRVKEKMLALKEQVLDIGSKYVQNERGEFVGTIGWMAIVSVILVLVHGMIKGWLPTFIQNVFNRMETLV